MPHSRAPRSLKTSQSNQRTIRVVALRMIAEYILELSSKTKAPHLSHSTPPLFCPTLTLSRPKFRCRTRLCPLGRLLARGSGSPVLYFHRRWSRGGYCFPCWRRTSVRQGFAGARSSLWMHYLVLCLMAMRGFAARRLHPILGLPSLVV